MIFVADTKKLPVMIGYTSKSGKQLYCFLKEKEETFQFHLLRLKYSINENDIHYLRRTAKRIKVLYKLFNIIDHRFKPKKKFKPLKNIFNAAGTLRELQVNQNVLLACNATPPLIKQYEEYISSKKKIYTSKLQLAIAKYKHKKHKKTIKHVKEICKKVEKKKLESSISDFLKETTNQIRALLNTEIEENNLHTIRILFKALNPALIFSEQLQIKGVTKEIISIYKNIEDKLGFWHDRLILRKSIEEMVAFGNPENTIQVEADKLIQQLITENKILFDEALEQVRSAIKKSNPS